MGKQRCSVLAASAAVWLLVLCECSADPTKQRPAGNNGTQTGNAGTAANSGSAGTGTDTGSFGNATGSEPSLGTAQPSQPAAPTVTASYIWIANSSEGTVSKINTRTLEELGRYKTRPDGQGRPSRTSVAQDGDVAVANRDGGVTKIYASVEKCKDKNGNGKIDTSTGKADVKAWGEDECVAWHTPIAYYSNRPMAWAPPSAPDAPAKLWTSAANTCSASACSVDVMRLNGETGVIEDTITVGGLNGVDFISASSFGGAGGGLLGSFLSAAGFAGTGVANYGAYGGASDARGNLWLFIANTTQLVRIDAASLQFRVWSVPMGNGYGITVDHVGRVFICGALGVSRFDPATELWENNFGAVTLGFNGCMTDGAKVLWVGGGADMGTSGLHAYDVDTLQLIKSYAVGDVKGVSVDIDGKIWGVGGGGSKAGQPCSAWRLDPVSGDIQSYNGLVGAYSYSDMTGFGLKTAGYTEPKPPS